MKREKLTLLEDLLWVLGEHGLDEIIDLLLLDILLLLELSDDRL